VSSRNREAIFRRLNELRIMRNRIFHHEPVRDRDVIGAHSDVLQTIGWMNAGVAHIVEEMSPLKAVHAAGWEAFRPDAIRLIKIPAPE
jgi:hypothetical protein